MPRRTHPAVRNQPRPHQTAPEPRQSYENMARDLVEKGLATIAILDRPRNSPMKPGEGA